MSNLHSMETLGLSGVSVQKPFSIAYGGCNRRYRAMLNFGATTSGPANGGASNSQGAPPTVANRPTIAAQIGDNVLLANIPQGAVFDSLRLNSTVSLGSAIIAIGTSPIHASNGQYFPANTFTTPNTMMLAGAVAAEATDPIVTPAGQAVYLTVAGAALPRAGTMAIDLYFTQA